MDDYNRQMQSYIKEMQQSGYKPIYSNGQLTGFEDPVRKMSIPLGNIDTYVQQQYEKELAEYNRQIAEFKQTGDIPPKWFDIKPGQSLLERWRGIIPSERLAYETEKLITKLNQGKTPTGQDKAYAMFAEQAIRGIGQGIPAIVERPGTVVTMAKEQPLATAATIGGILFSAGGLPQVGVPLLGAGAVLPYRKEILTDPYGVAGKIGGDFLTGYLVSKAVTPIVKPIVTKLKTIGAGKEFPVKTIDTPDGPVRVLDVVDTAGKPTRILIQEGAFAASEKPAVITQLKYAAEAKGQKFFTHAAPKAIKTIKYPDGTVGFEIGIDRGLYFAPESLISAKGTPQVYTYYSELSGAARDISYPRYVWEKYVLGKDLKMAKPGSRAALYVLEREFPDMPVWMKEAIIKQGKSVSSSTARSINYWAKQFDMENLGKTFKFKDKAGIVHDLTPDGLIKSIIKKNNPTRLELATAKAIYWENIKTSRGIIGGPEFLTLPHGPEWQLVEPSRKTLVKTAPTLREKILRKVGIERGTGYALLDNDIIDVSFFTEPKKTTAASRRTIADAAAASVVDDLIGVSDTKLPSLTAEVARRAERVRVRPSTPSIRVRLPARERQELRDFLTAPRAPSVQRRAERPRQREIERFTLTPTRPRPSTVRPREPRPRPDRPRPSPARPRPGSPRPRPPIFSLTPPYQPPRRRTEDKRKRRILQPIKRRVGRRGYILEPTLYGLTEGLVPKRKKRLSRITGFELLR